MAMNLGVGAPPKRKGAPPPPFGGGQGGSPAKAASPFAPGGGGNQRGAAVMDEPEPAPAAAPAKAAAPTPPPAGDAGGGGIPPEAVCYRSEMETCGNCTYNTGGECSKLSIPVSDGDGCNLFMDRGGEDLGSSGAAEGMEQEAMPTAA